MRVMWIDYFQMESTPMSLELQGQAYMGTAYSVKKYLVISGKEEFMGKAYDFKDENDIERFHDLEPELIRVFLDVCAFCVKEGMPKPLITWTVGKPKEWSTSETHHDGRAIDFRSWMYTGEEQQKIIEYANNKWAATHGTAPEDKSWKVLILEKDPAPHFHLQINRGVSLFLKKQYNK